MIEIKSFFTSDTFFAARNSHRGFESLFNSVFNPDKYDKIYILKGGPGTGKSTLMRGAVSFANLNKIECEAILCSSDPASLDGVTLLSGGRLAAIIDGTSPHTTDPKYPGAVEEIINLGEGFYTKALEDARRSIRELNRDKADQYSRAYSALSVAGRIFDEIWDILLKSKLYIVAENISQKISAELDGNKSINSPSKMIYSSFGKDGYKRLPIHAGRRVVNITGNDFFTAIVMKLLSERLASEGKLVRYSVSALDDRAIERLYTTELVIASNVTGESDFDLSDYSFDDADLAELYNSYRAMLSMSSSHFKQASAIHFEIESIYSSSIDFGSNEQIFDKLCNSLASLLC